MNSLTHTLMDDMLSRGEAAVADGERRLEMQRARVAALEKAGRATDQSLRLLKNMEQSQLLQTAYVARLKRDLSLPDYAPRRTTSPPRFLRSGGTDRRRPGLTAARAGLTALISAFYSAAASARAEFAAS